MRSAEFGTVAVSPRSAGASPAVDAPAPFPAVTPGHHPRSSAEREQARLLAGLAERLRLLRARRGLTRKALAASAGISERHLANLEHGTGNASILMLHQLAGALHCPLAELVGDFTTASPEGLLIRELLEHRSEGELRRARQKLAELFAASARPRAASSHIALIGLRGAGKSTLGRMLAEDLHYPFIELSREIEQIAGARPSEIHALYGASAYRRYERRALEEVLQIHPEAVIATPGGLVSDPATLNVLLAHCFTVWLQAAPEEHMQRVQAQGDLRPMSGNPEAMDDLERILAGRAAFYAKADLSFDTSRQPLGSCFVALRAQVRAALGLPA